MTSLLISVFSCIAVLLLIRYLRLRAESVTEYANAASNFFEIAGKLTSIDDVPVEILATVEAMNETVADKGAAGGLLAYLTNETRWKDSREAYGRRKKVLAEFFSRRPEIEPLYRQMVVSWFLAVTALSPLRGKLARLAMSEGAVEAAASRPRRDHHFGGDLTPNRGHPARA